MPIRCVALAPALRLALGDSDMFNVLINGQRAGTIAAPDYREAKRLARKAYGRRVDVIGFKKGIGQ